MLLAAMNRNRAIYTALIAVILLLAAAGASAQQRPKTSQQTPLLVMVSIDGLRPDYVTAADAHGAKIPNLRRFLREGTYAEGVEGVIPTVTYPSHTTLVTGVWPAKHGILGNTTFDPLRKNQEGWYWYAEDIRVPTLWDAAAKAHRKTASLQWPVTVGARVDWLIPEIWRASTPDDQKLLRAVSTPGLMEEAEKELGPYKGGIDTSVEADENRGRYAQWVIEKKHPGLLTLHLSSLDHIEHETAPFSPEAMAVLERLDAVVGALRESIEKAAPGLGYLAIVSDHGFVTYDQQLNLVAPLRQAGLIQVDDKGKISDWKAIPWPAGGSAAIVLKDATDAAVLAQVREILRKIAGDPANGVDRVLEAEELHRRGGYPVASFLVGLKPGWRTGSAVDGPMLSKVKPGGNHGYMPDLPDLRSSFFLIGPGVPAGRNLGVIDMRSIAPTLAARVGLSLPSADAQNLLP